MVKDPLKSVQLNLKLTWKILLQKVCQTAGFNFFVIDGPGIRVFTFERDIFQKILKIRIAFPGEIYFRLPFWFIRKVESFQLSTKFRFLTT